MQLVFVYGPPGVGKFSVGRELARLTGFGLFHNHLTVDLVAVLYPFGTEQFFRLVNKYRLEIVAEAVRASRSLIFTFVFSPPGDDAFVTEFTQPVLASGGQVRFVQLMCARDVLLERVQDPSRSLHGKLVDPTFVAGLLDARDLGAAVPGVESLCIDTTELSARDTAQRIVAHYDLPLITTVR